MKRMLFNATQEEELRVAIVDGQKLVDLDIEHAGKEQRKSNIYKGVITRVEPSLEAAFVDYGMDRHGFLPFKEISRQYFSDKSDAGRARIQDVIKEGQEMIVQVDKDERGSKGAALTTYISLAGRYLVLMPNNPRGGGVSRRVEGEERNELRDTMAELEVPKGMSMIARTAGIGRNAEELQWDLNYLVQLWKAIEDASTIQKGAFLIYQEGSLVIRAIRDYFSADIGEILIDTPDVHEQAVQFMNHVMPGNVARVKLYQDEIPLFSRFQIEHQIETAFAREVRLPSGGAIVIDHTEALVSVDVNSGRSIKGADIEQTAFNTNLEAAEEVARQLRLRDLGGLVVIDFIDMESQKNQREVENTLRDALHADRARVQTGKISRFGLLELSRQRMRPSLGETNHAACPRCSGTGHIRGIESTALHILRITQEEAMKDNSAIIQVQLPVEAATFLLNEKRADIHKIEQRMGVEVILIPNIHMETPNYSITRIKLDDVNEESAKPSYNMVEIPPETAYVRNIGEDSKPSAPEAVVKGIRAATAAPIVEEKPAIPAKSAKISFLGRIKKWLGADSSSGEVKHEVKSVESIQARDNNRDRDRGRNGNNRDRNRNRNNRDRNDKVQQPQQQARPERSPRPENAHQNRNEPRIQQNVEKPESVVPAITQGSPTEGAPQRERSRRSRGGRNRNKNRDRDQNRELSTTIANEVIVASVPEASAPEVAKQVPIAKTERVEKPNKVETSTVVESKPAEVLPTPEKPAKTKKAPAKKPKALKPVDLSASGLQLVETKAETKPTKTKAEPSKPKAPRKTPNWKKNEETTKVDAPLVMVETQK
jgi:ribonuclease E